MMRDEVAPEATLRERIAAVLSERSELSERELDEQARRLLSVLIEPTSSMIAAGDKAVITAAAWRAMVRAAIEED